MSRGERFVRAVDAVWRMSFGAMARLGSQNPSVVHVRDRVGEMENARVVRDDDQPLTAGMAASAATAFDGGGRAVPGGWHIYPEMAAADGLWMTASDLARFIIAIQKAAAGESNPVLSQAMTRLMLTRQMANGGLGLFLEGTKTTLFMHEGRDEGFDALMLGYVDAGGVSPS
jgi:CubicO group peptidase (beta-lactamase class C family)